MLTATWSEGNRHRTRSRAMSADMGFAQLARYPRIPVRPAREMPDEGKGLSLHGSSDPEQDAGVGRLVSRHGTSGHTDGDVNLGANLRCGPPARHTRMTSGQPANLEETLHGSGGCSGGVARQLLGSIDSTAIVGPPGGQC